MILVKAGVSLVKVCVSLVKVVRVNLVKVPLGTNCHADGPPVGAGRNLAVEARQLHEGRVPILTPRATLKICTHFK